jgi:hypothetical protein
VLHPNQFEEHEAWVAFQLSSVPMRVVGEASLHVFALMDAATRFILDTEFVSATDPTPGDEESQRLLAAGQERAGKLPLTLLVSREHLPKALERAAEALRVEVVSVPEAQLELFTRDARTGFAKRFGEA